MNSLAVAGGGVVARRRSRDARAGAGRRSRAGRARRSAMMLAGDGGAALLIDESYNANPASMRAALALARPRSRARRPAHRRPRRHAGARATRRRPARRRWPMPLTEADVDLVFTAGPLMRALCDALPTAHARRLCGNRAELDAARRRSRPARRRRHGQGLQRQPHGPDRRGAEDALHVRPQPRPRPVADRKPPECSTSLGQFGDQFRSSTSSATSPSAPAAR